MKQPIKKILGGLGIAVLALVGYVAVFGLYPRFFDIEWDEEVQLHDGRIIIVHVKRTFERLGTFQRWDGIHRDTEISFDAGGNIGRFTKKFQRYEVSLLEQKNTQWFIGLTGSSGTPPVVWVDFATPFLVLEPDGQLHKETLANFPIEFTRYNVMPATPNSQGIAKFNAQLLTIDEKTRHWKQYPTGAGDDGQIRRRNATTKGETK